MSASLISRLTDQNLGPMLFEHVRRLFHYCVAISPLFALSARGFEQSHVRRSYLVSVSTFQF